MSADLNFGLPDLVPQPQEQVNKISAASKIADMLNSEDHVPVCSNPSNAMNILQDISVAERELMASADADRVALQAKIKAKGDAPFPSYSEDSSTSSQLPPPGFEIKGKYLDNINCVNSDVSEPIMQTMVSGEIASLGSSPLELLE